RCLPIIFLARLHSLGIPNCTAQTVQSTTNEPIRRPPVCLPGPKIPAPLTHLQPEQTPPHITIDLVKLPTSVTSTKIVPPPTQNRNQPLDHHLDGNIFPTTISQISNLHPDHL